MLPSPARSASLRNQLRTVAAQDLPPLNEAARLLDQLRERIRMLHYSVRTKQAYSH